MPLSPPHVASSSIAATATTGIEKDEKATADFGAEWKTGNWCWEEPLPNDSDRCTVASGDSPPSKVKSEQGERNEPVAKSERSETVPKSERNEPVPKTEADPPPIKAENVRSTGSPDSVPSSSLSSPPLAQDSGVKAETKQPLERPKKQEDPGASSLQLPTPPPQGPEVKPEVKTESHHASPKMEDEQGDTAHENWAPGCFCWLPDASDLDVPEKRKRKRVPVEDDDAEARDVDAPEEKDCVSSSTAAMSKKNTEGSNKKSRRLPPRFPRAAALGCYRDDDESNCDIWSDGDATFDDIVSESDDESQGSILDPNGTIRDAKWEKMYQYLVQYKQKHGTTHVPSRYKADPKLGQWVTKQRSQCKRKDRIDRLNKIGFVWSIRSSIGCDDELWETMYQRLVEFKQKHGTTHVPFHYKADPKLGQWVTKQRSQCKRKDRIDRLNKIGFVWRVLSSSGYDDDSWETMYQRLAEYKQKHGTTQVPRIYKEDPKLGYWVSTQRTFCKKKDRIDRLNKIGFVWSVRSSSVYDDELWETMYQRLVQYKKKHGTTNVPRKYKEDPKLGLWVRTQRAFCKRKDRLDRLNEIGFVWSIRSSSGCDDELWEKMYQRLVEYKQKHGTTQVPQEYKGDPKLGQWASSQRSRCKRKDRIDRLNEIGFVWSIRSSRGCDDELWEKMYQRLVEYKQKHGTTQVPQEYKGDPKLGYWVRTQRTFCKRKDRIDRLNEIGFVWRVLSSSLYDDELWEKMYQRLVEYKKKHGTTQVPTKYKADPKLGQWASSQRSRCKRKDRIDRLNEIGFVWRVWSSSGYDDELWEKMYQRLVEYKQKHGTTHVPFHYKADPKLGQWASSQRSRCRRKDRIDRLNRIGFLWKVEPARKTNPPDLLKSSSSSSSPPPPEGSENQTHVKTGAHEASESPKKVEEPSISSQLLSPAQGPEMKPEAKAKSRKDEDDLCAEVSTDWTPGCFCWLPDLAASDLEAPEKVKRKRVQGKDDDDDDEENAMDDNKEDVHSTEDNKDRPRFSGSRHCYFRCDDQSNSHFSDDDASCWEIDSESDNDSQISTFETNNCRRSGNERHDHPPNSIRFQSRPCQKEWGATGESKWEIMYQRLTEYKQKNGSTRVPHLCKADPQLADWVSSQRKFCRRPDLVDRLNEIGFIWKQGANRCDDDSWETMYQRLVEFKQQHGTTQVPHKYKEEQKLARWVSRQRACCRRKDRIDRLNEIGFVWSINSSSWSNDESWEKMFQCLVEFKQKHGTTQVPQKYKEDQKLGEWVHTQRVYCKRKDRIDRLNEIGFVWRVLSTSLFDDESWETMYQRLVEYKQKHGTTKIPYEYKEDPKLGHWVHTQRVYCKRKDRIDRLNEIGFVWRIYSSSGHDDELWEKMFQRLVEYKQKHGTTHVRFKYKEDPKLGTWVQTQRSLCKRKDRIDRLNEIGFVWSIRDSSVYDDESWETMYQRLVEYKQKHGTTKIPYKYKEDPKLGHWVHTQRTFCKRKDRIDRLNEIGFVWRIYSSSGHDDELWEKMFQRLVEYKQKHGTTHVRFKYKEDPKLGKWVQTQRSLCKRKDRIDRLNEIGFVWSIRSSSGFED